jgi:hypothetical protein
MVGVLALVQHVDHRQNLATMKTLPYTPARPRSTRKLMVSLAQSIALLAVIIWATSCTCRIECSPDIPAAIRIIEIIAEK